MKTSDSNQAEFVTKVVEYPVLCVYAQHRPLTYGKSTEENIDNYRTEVKKQKGGEIKNGHNSGSLTHL